MRFLSLFLTFFLHAGIFGLAFYWTHFGAPPIKLDVPVYYVDLINLAGAPDKPGPADPAKLAAKAPKPDPAPAPKPAPKPKAAPIKEPAKPAAVVPPPKPEPQKAPKPVVADKQKPISPKKKPEKPKPKKEVKKDEKPKKKLAQAKPKQQPKPKETKKEPTRSKRSTPQKAKRNQPPTRNQIVAQALQATQMEVAKQDKMDQDAVARALADLRHSQQGGTGQGGQGSGTGGGGAGGHEGAYLRAMSQIIKDHWAYPMLNDKVALQAQVEISLDSRGQIRGFVLTRSSGRPDFDASTMKAVDETRLTERLPEPPGGLRTIRINFNSQELG